MEDSRQAAKVLLDGLGRVAVGLAGNGERLEIPGGVREIAAGAFAGCQGLRSVRIPAGVREIRDSAFAGCAALESVSIAADTAMGAEAFAGCAALRSVHAPKVSEIGPCAFQRCQSLEDVVLSRDLWRIPERAFAGCSSLRALDFLAKDGRARLREIGRGAFAGCVSLEEAALPDSVREIGAGAFHGCSSLRTVRLPAELEGLEAAPFLSCPAPRMDTDVFSRIDPDESLARLLCEDSDPRFLARAVAMGVQPFWRARADRVVLRRPALASSVADELCAILEQEVAWTGTAGRAAFFVLEHAGTLEEAVLDRFVDAGGRLGGQTWKDMCQDHRLRAARSGLPCTPAADPALALAQEDWQWSPDLDTLREAIPRGVRYADGPGMCHPDALAALLASVSRRTLNERTGVGLPFPGGSGSRIVRLLDREDLRVLLEQIPLRSAGLVKLVLPAWLCLSDPSGILPATEAWRLGSGGRLPRGLDPRMPDDVARRVHMPSGKPRGSWDVENMMLDTPEAMAQWVRRELGLDADWSRKLDLGDRVVTARLEEGRPFALVDSSGRRLKALPRKADADLRRRASDWLADANRQLQRVRMRLKADLARALLHAESMDPVGWKSSFMGHPEYRAMARALVWQQGRSLFALGEDGLRDADGAPVELGLDPVILAHPAEMDPQRLEAWRRLFASKGVQQPLAQLDAPVLDPALYRVDRYSHVPIRRMFPGLDELLGLGDGSAPAGPSTRSSEGCLVSFTARDGVVELGGVYVTGTWREAAAAISVLDRAAAWSLAEMNDVRALDYLDTFARSELEDLARLAGEHGGGALKAALLERIRDRFEADMPLSELDLE